MMDDRFRFFLLVTCHLPLAALAALAACRLPLATCSLQLAVAIGALILLQPVLPYLFNNVGFCYFIVSLINSKEAVANLPSNLLSLLLGCVCLNLGCSLLLTLYKKSAVKKAKA